MLRAVVDDVLRMPGWLSVTTLETELCGQVAGEVVPVESPLQEARVFERLLNEVDAVLVIAPETGGVLADRCRRVAAAGVKSWNCQPQAIDLCGDKLRLGEHLESFNLPTIPTKLADLSKQPCNGTWPLVLKPRDGAGSNLTFLVRNGDEWSRAMATFRRAGLEHNCLLQPYREGRALSIALNISLDGRHIECLPVGEQILMGNLTWSSLNLSDNHFQYLGGKIPADISPVDRDAIERVVREACRTIPGLAGYIGMDLLLTSDRQIVIVEINPRLTTSYVGYRKLYSTPLCRQWLSSEVQLVRNQITSADWLVTEIRAAN